MSEATPLKKQGQARLESIEDKIDRRKQTLEKYNEKIREQKGAAASFHEIDSIGKKTISGNISMTPQGGKRSGEKRIKGF